MKKSRAVPILIATCVLVLAVTITTKRAGIPSPTDTVEALFAAFNAHAPERMAALVSADFELYYMVDGETSLGTKGPDALRKEMAGYFGSLPTVKSQADIALVSGSYVACHEVVSWQHEGGTRSQFSLAVYEVREGKIRRTWYYPAER